MSASQILLFELDDGEQPIGTFGVDVGEVWQVIEPTELREVPLCPPTVVGIMSYGGRIVTVVDPSPVLGFAAQSGPIGQVVIVRDERRPLGNLGLKVSRIRQIVDMSAMKEADVAAGPHIRCAVQLGARLVHVIDVAAFMNGLGKEFGPAPDAAPREGVTE
ncbi:MAG: chemotaxis protein CheW [Myxococcota bacterium]